MDLIKKTIDEVDLFLKSNLSLNEFYEIYKFESLKYTLPCLVKFFLWIVVLRLTHPFKVKYLFELNGLETLMCLFNKCTLIKDNDYRFGYLRYT